MKDLIKNRMRGFDEPIKEFANELYGFDLTVSTAEEFSKIVAEKMAKFGYDEVFIDNAGNVIGKINGYKDEGDIILVSHMDPLDGVTTSGEHYSGESSGDFKAGIVSGLFAGALLKNAMLALKGNVYFCCVPRFNGGEGGIEYLLKETLKNSLGKIKGVILCEPTKLDVYLGHKGKMEYEIQVRGRFPESEQAGPGKMGIPFPLISELSRVAGTLPVDANLGKSRLSVRDVSYGDKNSGEKFNEFKLTIDRVFVPEESHESILGRAKSIAQKVYETGKNVSVSTAVAKEKVKVYTGYELNLEKKYEPWIMEPYHPFVLKSMESLADSGLRSVSGYWKKTYTLGSFTYGKFRLPTIGFGAGSEEQVNGRQNPVEVKEIEKAVTGAAWIIHKNIGIPSFGWSSDEI